MDTIRIQGLRSLLDTGDFPLKKLNVLVGTNSSGKSTFLRVFPLLRQSVERKTRGPILWSGDYIDFDSFGTSIYKPSSVSSKIENKDHSAEVRNHNNSTSSINNIKFSFNLNMGHDSNKKQVYLSIHLSEVPKTLGCYTSRFICMINKLRITFDFNKDGIITDVNSNVFSWPLEKHELKYQLTDTDTLVPLLSADTPASFDQKNRQIGSALREQIKGLLLEHSGSISTEKANTLFIKLTRSILDSDEKIKTMRLGFRTSKWRRTLNSWDENNDDFTFISGLIDLYFIIENSSKINALITDHLLGVRYIAPLRTSTQRYYRYQDVSIDELDHEGENIAMFISNISGQWREKLNNWTKDEFGFHIKESTSFGHTSISIVDNQNDTSSNISDMGFGYSQVLPIIIQLWSISSGYENSKKRKKNLSFIFAIEQPELHLHPRMQAKLARVFTKSIKLAEENNINIKIILETHSEAIVSKFGELVLKNEISANDLAISCFEQDRKSRITNITTSTFNEAGRLTNWPLGFFDY